MDLGDVSLGARDPGGTAADAGPAATLDHAVLPGVAGRPRGVRRWPTRPGQVVSREELLRVLPGDSGDPHTAEVAVARLREAVGLPGAGAHGDQARLRLTLASDPVAR